MEQAQPSSTLTLEEVHHHFQQWRDTRTSQTEPTPDALLAEARSLLGRYSQPDILRKLGLTRKRLLLAAASSAPIVAQSEEDTDSPPFVQIPWPSPEATTSCLEIEHPNGMTLRLQNCNGALLSQMISTFMDHSPCCK